jgi:ribonuclease-3 family protein
MEKNMDILFGDINKYNDNIVKSVNPIVLAYIGDSLYELFVRLHIISQGYTKPAVPHKKSVSYVNAHAQAALLENISDILTEEEKEVVRRGRNAQSYTIPKNVDIEIYKQSTAFEALLGYLYLLGNEDRLKTILNKCIIKT